MSTVQVEEALKLTEPEPPPPETEVMDWDLAGWIFLSGYYAFLGGLLLLAVFHLLHPWGSVEDQIPPLGTALLLATARLGCIRLGYAKGWGRTIGHAFPLHTPADAPAGAPISAPRFELRLRAAATPRCALCHDANDLVACPTCHTLLHVDCAAELPTCPTLGCTSTVVRRVSE